MTTTFEAAKVGERVWDIKFGWGEICDTTSSYKYPIRVYFPNVGVKTYTEDGFYSKDDISRSLFWDEVEIEAPQKPLPELEVDTKVLVWVYPSKKVKRHFSHFSNGIIYTFDSGTTSFTKQHEKSVTPWEFWELAE